MNHKKFEHLTKFKMCHEKRSWTPKMNYHSIDRNGRFYFCGCSPNIRIGNRVVITRIKRGYKRIIRSKWNINIYG